MRLIAIASMIALVACADDASPSAIDSRGCNGAYSAAPAASRISFNRHLRDSMEVLDIGWHYWEFAAGFGVYDPVAQQFRAALLESMLGAPRPR